MRVLHVNNWHRGFGGSDNACRTVIELCRRRGLDISVFEFDSKLLPNGLRGQFSAFINGIYARPAVREFDLALRRSRPDIVHVHELFPLISPWVLPRCAASNIPVVMTCYDFRLTCPIATHHNKNGICYECAPGREYRAVVNNCRNSLPESIAYSMRNAIARKFGLFTNHVDKFVVLTEFSRRWITQRANVPAERVAVIPCIVPSPDTGVQDPASGRYVAYSGRFAKEKGVDMLIEACRRARLPLRLAGNQTGYHAIRPEDDIQCVETPTRESLASFYRGARVLAVASLWEETFATVLSEAKSHGVPVVAPRIGALVDLVDDGTTGLLFETGNVDDLAEKLLAVWNDPDLCRSLGAAGRIDVQRELSEDACFQRLVTLYRGLVPESLERK